MGGKGRVAGGATLGMTLLLLLLMGGMLAFSVQQQVNELRIQASEFRQQEALSQAEGELAQAMALLMHYRHAAPAQASWPRRVDVVSHALPLLDSQGWMWQLSAQAGEDEAHAVVRRQLLAYPLLLRLPHSGWVTPDPDAAEGVKPLDYLFGFTSAAQAITALSPLATQTPHECNSLDSQSRGLILVQGRCVLRGQIGSAEQPVLLALNSSELQLASDVTFYGLMLLLGEGEGPALHSVAGPRLYGGLVSSYPLAEMSSGLVIGYDPEILAQLQHSPLLWRFELVAGSWRDW